MSDMHAMTRIVSGRRVPSEVVNIKTGERLYRAPVDGREMVATGEWRWADLPEDSSPKVIPTTTDSEGNPLYLETVESVPEPTVVIVNPDTVTLPPVEVGPPVVVEAPVVVKPGLWKQKAK